MNLLQDTEVDRVGSHWLRAQRHVIEGDTEVIRWRVGHDEHGLLGQGEHVDSAVALREGQEQLRVLTEGAS